MNPWGNFDVDPNIKVLELRIHQSIRDPNAANTGAERSRRHRHAFANLQRSLLPVEGPELRVLEQLGIGFA